MTPLRSISAVAIGAVIVFVWLWFFPPMWWLNVTKPVDLSDPVRAGMSVVEEYECRQCHFIGDQGKFTGPNLAGVTQRLDAVSLRLWLRNPRAIKWNTPMPYFRLSDGEIEAIVAYLGELDDGEPKKVLKTVLRPRSSSCCTAGHSLQSSRIGDRRGYHGHPRRPSARGFDPASRPTAPLVNHRMDRQLSWWNLPSPVTRAFGAH
jgi:cytochrome c2